MNKIVYYVATSIDGFICGQGGDISGFVADGNGVQQYLNDLKEFETVIMGRKTYEFGYSYGLEPGKPAYPHMRHYIFSDALSFDNPDPKVMVKKIDLQEVIKAKESSKTDVYLCGGGIFAGWLLENEMIDILKIKLNPLILGEGTNIFDNSKKKYALNLFESKEYQRGLVINSYTIVYK